MKRWLPRHPAGRPAHALVTTDAEPHSSAKINSERRISGDLLVKTVQQVFDVHVCGHAVIDLIPSSRVDQHISGRVIHVEAEKIGVSAAADKSAAQVRAPAAAGVGGQQRSRMLRTANKGLTCG